MSPRRPGLPIGGTGRVTLHEPTTARPYYRIVYLDETGQRQHVSGSRSAQTAWNRAQALDARLAGRADPRARTLGDLVAEYVRTPVGRKCDKDGYPRGTDWSTAYHTSVAQDLARAVADVADVPAHALDLAVVDRMRAACGTRGMVKQQTARVRGFLNWANRQHALTDAQAALLPARRALPLDPRFPQPVARPSRQPAVPMIGQSEDYIGPEDCPLHDAVRAFAHELQQRVRWGALAVHFAAGTGLRVGEQFQLRADDIVARDGHLVVKVDWQWSTGRGRRTAPKTRKRRRVPVLPVTRDGAPLEQMLRDRADEARAEQAAGTNPEALLFPAPEGGMWWSSNLSELLVAAQKAAGWSFVVVPERRKLRNGKTAEVMVTQMQHPWHSLRHRFARDMIDWVRLTPARLMAIGGWESLEVLSSRYYRAGSEHWDTAASAVFGVLPGTSAEPWTATTTAGHPAGADQVRAQERADRVPRSDGHRRSGARPTTRHASTGGSQIRAAALGRRSSTRTD